MVPEPDLLGLVRLRVLGAAAAAAPGLPCGVIEPAGVAGQRLA